MARFCNHSYNENATMLSVCTVELHVTANNIATMSVAQKYVYGEFTFSAVIEGNLLHK
jgi:hypothetical protein